MSWLKRLASIRLAIVGMLLLAVGAMMSYGGRFGASVWVLVLPLGLMSVNLLAAIITNRKINRQPGLLIFHLSLLGIVLLAGIGRLTHLDAQVEMVEGAEFTPHSIVELKHGPLHQLQLDQLHFVQGPYRVFYEPYLQRGATESELILRGEQGSKQNVVVGDDTPFVWRDYRFYSSFNKGYSVVLTWLPDNGVPVTGAVNMPSYPLYDYKQKNAWTPPGTSTPVELWLKLTTAMDQNTAWVLQRQSSSGVLAVTQKDRRVELLPGQSMKLEGGTLRYDQLSMWMGYTVFYDPTLRWLFFVSVFGVFGLGWHLWKKSATTNWKG